MPADRLEALRERTRYVPHDVEKGLIYRDNYMVNWDPGTRSAISDLEVEQRRVEDKLYSIDYPLESGSGSRRRSGSERWLNAD